MLHNIHQLTANVVGLSLFGVEQVVYCWFLETFFLKSQNTEQKDAESSVALREPLIWVFQYE